MKIFLLIVLILLTFFSAKSQTIPKKRITVKKITGGIKIDGELNDMAWKNAAQANEFTQLEPTPFLSETADNRSEVKFVYDNNGVYIGGYMHETNKDSIASELTGRDGFGNNDFIGVTFDTYQDKLNGFEYFVTPLNEQWDAKVSPGRHGEDFSWNAVWQSGVKMHNDGWSFEMFIPYSAIRFGNKAVQSWGVNLIRQRRKSGQKLLWQPVDPNINGFLTQEGTITGLENIKPPLRLQLSPYFSTYYNNNGYAAAGEKKSDVSVNGGMDVKYGINQAFTLDMTLIPDFGQVQTDKLSLNLSPFERRYNENRAFFTEGTELFNKGNLLYTRRIGGEPIHLHDYKLSGSEKVTSNPSQSKLVNATKISGRTQKGLGIGILNAVTKPQYALIEDSFKNSRKFETDPLTNYNVFVLDQTLKNNSSVSFVNTSVLRSGKDYDADVAAILFDLNNKSNTRKMGGRLSISNIFAPNQTVSGYAHALYVGKTSGRFNFNVFQEVVNRKYDKSDLGYSTNNNFVNHRISGSYNWNKPKGFFNRKKLNAGIQYGRSLTPIDFLKRKEFMFNSLDFNINGDAEAKNLWSYNYNIHIGSYYHDYYEARDYGRVFSNKGSKGIGFRAETNSAKKISGNGGLFMGTGGIFHSTTFNPSIGGKIRFNTKFSIEGSANISTNKNAIGWANTKYTGNLNTDTIIFSRRNVNNAENELNLKYNLNNKTGISLHARHSWTKVDPQQFYELDINGNLQTPTKSFTKNVNQNYNFLSVDMVYNNEFAPGSFITLAWKDIGQSFTRSFEKNYTSNLGNILSGKQFTSFSLKVIYFLDYVTFRNKLKEKRST